MTGYSLAHLGGRFPAEFHVLLRRVLVLRRRDDGLRGDRDAERARQAAAADGRRGAAGGGMGSSWHRLLKDDLRRLVLDGSMRAASQASRNQRAKAS